MDLWEQEDIDLVASGLIELGKDHRGSLRFIAVEGSIDWRDAPGDGRPGAEFTWEGFDEGDPSSGPGGLSWQERFLERRSHSDLGDDSGFRADGSSSYLPDVGPAVPDVVSSAGRSCSASGCSSRSVLTSANCWPAGVTLSERLSLSRRSDGEDAAVRSLASTRRLTIASGTVAVAGRCLDGRQLGGPQIRRAESTWTSIGPW